MTCPRCGKPTTQEIYGPCPDCRVDLNTKASPVARNSDPWTSKLAAERIEPKRETRKANVVAIPVGVERRI